MLRAPGEDCLLLPPEKDEMFFREINILALPAASYGVPTLHHSPNYAKAA